MGRMNNFNKLVKYGKIHKYFRKPSLKDISMKCRNCTSYRHGVLTINIGKRRISRTIYSKRKTRKIQNLCSFFQTKDIGKGKILKQVCRIVKINLENLFIVHKDTELLTDEGKQIITTKLTKLKESLKALEKIQDSLDSINKGNKEKKELYTLEYFLKLRRPSEVYLVNVTSIMKRIDIIESVLLERKENNE